MRHYRVRKDEKWGTYEVQVRGLGLWWRVCDVPHLDDALRYAERMHECSKRKGYTVVAQFPPVDREYL